MTDVEALLMKADLALGAGKVLTDNGFDLQAGREAYLAAFHAANAYIEAHSGKRPKTHGGTHSEFARLAHLRGDLPADLVAFLGRSFTLKMVSDYETHPPVAPREARLALAVAQDLVATVRSCLNIPAAGKVT